jgi:AcrR family transcriptional regulator
MAVTEPAQRHERVRPRGEHSRDRILDAAEALMAEHGFTATSVSAICRRSGLPPSSLYWHFGSKENLLAAVIERGAMRWIDEIEGAPAPAGPPRQRLHDLLQRLGSTFAKRPTEYIRLLMLVTLERREQPGPWHETMERVRERVRVMIQALLFDVFQPTAGDDLARTIARDGAAFALVFGDGVMLTAETSPRDVDPPKLVADLETALLALGDRRLTSTRRGRAS